MFSTYHTFLEKNLSPARMKHSLGTMETMAALAPVYGLDPTTAQTVGLLHDAAKDLPAQRWQAIVEEAGIPTPEECDRDYNLYLHGPVGAALIQAELGVSDPAVIHAVYTHTHVPGPDFHSPLVWCMRFSDILEPNRDWRSISYVRAIYAELRELAFGGQMHEAALLQTRMLIEWFSAAGYLVHPNMHRTIRDLATRGAFGLK